MSPTLRRLALLPLMAATGCAAPKLGVLKLAGSPDEALVTVDDKYVGKLGRLKQRGVRVNAGSHRVTLEANGRFPHDELVTVPGDGETRLEVQLEPIPD